MRLCQYTDSSSAILDEELSLDCRWLVLIYHSARETSGRFTQLISWYASDNTKAVYIGQEDANRNLTHGFGHRGLGHRLSSLMLMGLWGGWNSLAEADTALTFLFLQDHVGQRFRMLLPQLRH